MLHADCGCYCNLDRGHFTDKHGVKRFTGYKKELRDSGWDSQFRTAICMLYLLMIDVLLKHEPKSRSYTKAFGRAILQLWQEECADSQPRLCLRQKIHISAGKTDKDLFTALPVGDTWVDAGMVEVWIYLFQNKKLLIPAGWQDVMQDFNKELQDSAPY